MFNRVGAQIVALSLTLSGCALYPGFDQLPNPDLYYIDAGDVIGGVKCAMLNFLYERQYLQGGDEGTFINSRKRFELNPDLQAAVELVLDTSTAGGVSYAKIDADKIAQTFGRTAQNSFITVGNSASGLPFPSASATVVGSNTVDITFNMSQTLEKAEPLVFNKKRKVISNLKDDVMRRTNKKFVERCMGSNENGVVVDYLGLKNWLTHLLNQEEDAVWRGSPEIYLDTIVLTTSFDAKADVSFGVNHLLRLVPIIGVPTVDIKPDHSHKLKVTLHGYKDTTGPIDPSEIAKNGSLPKSQALEEAQIKLTNQCIEDSGADATTCKKPLYRLLERLIQANGKKT